MRASFDALIADRGSAAVGAFTCYNLEIAAGVLRAAAQRRVGVILLVSAQAFRARDGDLLLAALVAMADRAPVLVCVQLDHASDLELFESAFALGAGAVMADGSKLPYDENVALVRAAVELGARFGGQVEAELGRVEGDEDVALAAEAGALTDPDEAAAFVSQTGVACLAVSIGNVHGIYRSPPRLDWQRLESVRECVGPPLSLHGASGLCDADVRRAVSLGIAKVNVNTELRHRYLEVTGERLPELLKGSRVLDLNAAQADGVEAVAAAKLDAFVSGDPPAGA